MCVSYIKSHKIVIIILKKGFHHVALPFCASAQSNLMFRLDVSIQQRISPPLMRVQTILSGLLPSSSYC